MMDIGKMYLYIWKRPTDRLPRRSVMKLIGEDGDHLYFSARPVAGTQELPKLWLISATEVPQRSDIVLEEIVR